MSALGQKQTVQRKRHVHFTPESGHVQCTSSCPLWANSGLMQRSKDRYSTTSSASAISAGWYGETEGLGGLEVNYEIKFCGLHDRQFG